MAWKQNVDLFYFDKVATDLEWCLVNGGFCSVAGL